MNQLIGTDSFINSIFYFIELFVLFSRLKKINRSIWQAGILCIFNEGYPLVFFQNVMISPQKLKSRKKRSQIIEYRYISLKI